MGGQIVIGAIMMLVTTVVHSGFTILTIRGLMKLPADNWFMLRIWRAVVLIGLLVLALFLALLIEAGLWAIVFTTLDAIDELEPALYFSIVTFTTLGYGDIVLDERWRILATFEAQTASS